MKRKKLERKHVKSVGKLHWPVVVIGFLMAIATLELAFITLNLTVKPWLIATSLFSFGVAFNQMITWLEVQDWEEGATALLVVMRSRYSSATSMYCSGALPPAAHRWSWVPGYAM